jgi:hypothetical protein
MDKDTMNQKRYVVRGTGGGLYAVVDTVKSDRHMTQNVSKEKAEMDCATLNERDPGNINAPTDIHNEIDRGMKLLALCQRLQSEKDGVDRPEPGVSDKTKVLDQFAVDISRSMTNMSALHKLIPMMLQLGALGRKLHEEGKIEVDCGGDYSTAALNYLLVEHGLDVAG